MEVVQEVLPGDGFAKMIESHSDGVCVVVRVGLFIFAQWSVDDGLSRDLFLVAGRGLELSGKSLSRLAHASEAHVSRTIARYTARGLRGLVERGTPGRSPALGAAGRAHARALRESGMTQEAIAEKLRVGVRSVRTATKGVVVRPVPVQMGLPDVSAAPSAPPAEPVPSSVASDVETSPAMVEEPASASSKTLKDEEDPLCPAARLPADGRWHACRYAGTTLAVAGVLEMGLCNALERAEVTRPPLAWYSARQALVALVSAWTAGHTSIEAMHERDARALGVVLGLERSPSVRTLWRAVAQMIAAFDPTQWWIGWMLGVMAVRMPETPVWGIDGHFKSYGGSEPIDKGFNTKRRMAERGVATVRLMDLHGFCWSDLVVRAGDTLSAHVLDGARALAEAQRQHPSGIERPIVLAFDRGGFDFDVLGAMDAAGYFYLAWVPSRVKMPDLATIAPSGDGIAEAAWVHPRLEHRSRLLVERDGEALLPATTNLPTLVDAAEAMRLLRAARGMEENGIKAAKAFVPIDHLDDRGAVAHRPDDRPTHDPARHKLEKLAQELVDAEADLHREKAVRGERSRSEIGLDAVVNEVQQRVVRKQIRTTPVKVPRVSVEPDAVRAELDQRNRALLLPLKNATENARRWLLAELGAALAPSDHEWDQDTRARTLTALLRAPGRMRFQRDVVEVEIDLQLPPMPHARLAARLVALDGRMRFEDGRTLRVRMAPRPRGSDVRGTGAAAEKLHG